jgi:hypothetical protein
MSQPSYPYEVSEEEVQAWAKQELRATPCEIRGTTLEFVQCLRACTEELREEKRKAWEEDMVNASPEMRHAAERV